MEIEGLISKISFLLKASPCPNCHSFEIQQAIDRVIKRAIVRSRISDTLVASQNMLSGESGDVEDQLLNSAIANLDLGDKTSLEKMRDGNESSANLSWISSPNSSDKSVNSFKDFKTMGCNYIRMRACSLLGVYASTYQSVYLNTTPGVVNIFFSPITKRYHCCMAVLSDRLDLMETDIDYTLWNAFEHHASINFVHLSPNDFPISEYAAANGKPLRVLINNVPFYIKEVVSIAPRPVDECILPIQGYIEMHGSSFIITREYPTFNSFIRRWDGIPFRYFTSLFNSLLRMIPQHGDVRPANMVVTPAGLRMIDYYVQQNEGKRLMNDMFYPEYCYLPAFLEEERDARALMRIICAKFGHFDRATGTGKFNFKITVSALGGKVITDLCVNGPYQIFYDDRIRLDSFIRVLNNLSVGRYSNEAFETIFRRESSTDGKRAAMREAYCFDFYGKRSNLISLAGDNKEEFDAIEEAIKVELTLN